MRAGRTRERGVGCVARPHGDAAPLIESALPWHARPARSQWRPAAARANQAARRSAQPSAAAPPAGLRPYPHLARHGGAVAEPAVMAEQHTWAVGNGAGRNSPTLRVSWAGAPRACLATKGTAAREHGWRNRLANLSGSRAAAAACACLETFARPGRACCRRQWSPPRRATTASPRAPTRPPPATSPPTRGTARFPCLDDVGA